MNTRKDNNGKALTAWMKLGPAVIVHPLRYARQLLRHHLSTFSAEELKLSTSGKYAARRLIDAEEMVKNGDGMAAKALARYAEHNYT